MPKDIQTTAQLSSSHMLAGEGNGTPLQYSCLENPMDGGAWQAAVHGVAKSWTPLSDFTFTFHFHALEKEIATTPVFLPGESQGWGSLVGCRLWGHTESETTEGLSSSTCQQSNAQEFADVQAGFRKGRGTRDQIEKAKDFRKNIYFFIDYTKAFDCVDHNKLWKILKEMGIPQHHTCLLGNLYAGQ